jgi:uncharacterized protein Veg
MGCRSSRLDAAHVSPAAALCRQRRDLLRAAAAHAAYFRALPRVADALARFASHHHPATPPGSPVLTLPPSDHDEPKKHNASSNSRHSHIHFCDDDASDDTDPDSSPDACAGPGGCGGGHGHGQIPQPTPVVHSGVPPPDHGHGLPQEHQVHQPPLYHRPQEQVYQPQERQVYPPLHHQPLPEMPWEYTSYNPYPSFPTATSFPDATFQNDTFPRYYYMKASSTPANTVYQDPYGHGNYNTYMGYNNPMYGAPMPPEGDPRPAENRAREPAPPPPMPVSETTPWDFFDPFDAYQQELPLYKWKGYDANGSSASSPNSSEVRTREGIPELELETEMDSMRESVKARKAVESSSSNRIANVDVAAKVKESMERRECEIESVASASVVDTGEESVCSCDDDHADAKPGVPVGDDQGIVKKVSSAEHTSMVVGEDVRLPENIGTRDVAEVVEEIKEQFNSVASCGEDVARILEVGRMRYKSRKRILRCKYGSVFVLSLRACSVAVVRP